MCRTPLLALTLLVAAPLLAPSPVLAQDDAERYHVVRAGDTLWDIANTYLGDPFRWPEIHRANAGLVADPHRIYPDARLRVPGGAVAQAAAAESQDAEVAAAPASVAPGITPTPVQYASAAPPARGRFASEGSLRPGEQRTVFYRQAEPAHESAAPVVRPVTEDDVPAFTPALFFSAGLLVQPAEVPSLGTLRDKEAPTVVPMTMTPQIQLRDRVHLTVTGARSPAIGERLQLLRPARRVEGFGQVYVATGMVVVQSVEQGVATAVVDQMFAQIEPGDVMVPLATFPLRSGVRARPATGVEGRLVAFESQHPLVNVQEMVFLDVGAASGVGVGDEFEVYIPPQQRSWGTQPAVSVAELQVVRVTDRTATARVIALRHPALEPGQHVRQIRRMP